MKRKYQLTAKNADIYDLYEQSVQSVEFEVEFINKMFKRYNRGICLDIREDFCSSAFISTEWVKAKNKNAYAVDIDKSALKIAHEKAKNRISKEQLNRLFLIKGNSLNVKLKKVNCILATNFSYWVFKERESLKKYFFNTYNNLKKNGIFILDAFGGYEAHQELEEKTKHKNFTYVWDQSSFNPINNDLTCYIHFEFNDGSKINKAFKYDWRLWSLPEITECLKAAGFKQVDIYMQGWDKKKDEESDKFYCVKKCDADAGWIAYIVALR
ncbi:MAG: SAM-dependent methyltransferase [Gammaproteobacteria bacterium]|nr:SAM-dependent methyltransferase [Gammaproteobacteria bacterium]|tara:strand:- start:4725 stop:5531 length:807 start_codon:yes stop_codon:yes gene_type:complete